MKIEAFKQWWGVPIQNKKEYERIYEISRTVMRLGGCPLGGIQHDEQLHEPLVHRGAERLDDERVAAADRDLEAGQDLARGEGAVLGGHELGAEREGHLFGESRCELPLATTRRFPWSWRPDPAMIPRSTSRSTVFFGSIALFLRGTGLGSGIRRSRSRSS